MVVEIRKIDHATSYVICASAYGTIKGKWCDKIQPEVHQTYDVEIDIPYVVALPDVQLSSNQIGCMTAEAEITYLNALVEDQDDNTLTLRLGDSIFLVEVAFTSEEFSCLYQMLEIKVENINIYNTNTLM